MVGLVLAGGGVKGAYQVGAYKAFRECKIKIDGIVGTSIGSLNAALIVSGKDKELDYLWSNTEIGEVLGLNKNYIDSVNNKELFKELLYGFKETASIIKGRGIKRDNLRKLINDLVDEDKLFASNVDYGLVTVRLKDLKPLYLFKSDMNKDKLADYILASCNLPVFKKEKMIDDNYYIDGGFYDNNPVNMLLDKGYDKVYSIEVQGLGFKRKIKDKDKVITIKPSRYLGTTLSINKKLINNNIKLGYYDAIKVLKNYDGYNFIFKKHMNLLYNMLARKADSKNLGEVRTYFNTKDNKELILKSLEFIMNKENITYYKIHNVRRVIRYIKKNTTNKHFIYKFVRSLKVF